MKKLVVVTLTLAMLISANSAVFASETDSVKDILKSGTVTVQVDSRTLKQSKDSSSTPVGALPAKSSDVSEFKPPMRAKGYRAPQTAAWKYLPNYLVYNQITSYNCGPASVQAALNYLNGYAPDQSQIAWGCKTTTNGSFLNDMKNYINRKQSKNRYVAKYNQSKNNMRNQLYTGISNNVPPIIGLSFSTSDGWLYSSGGHFMTVFGANKSKSEFVLGDPWIGYSDSGVNDSSWSYTKSAATIYNAYNNVNIGLMY